MPFNLTWHNGNTYASYHEGVHVFCFQYAENRRIDFSQRDANANCLMETWSKKILEQGRKKLHH